MAITLRIETVGGVAEVTGSDPKDVIEQASFWQSLPKLCPICSAELKFEYTKHGDDEFHKLVCLGMAKHTTNIGKSKDGTKVYYKGDASYRNPKTKEVENPWQMWSHEAGDYVSVAPPKKASGAEVSPTVSGKSEEVVVLSLNQLTGFKQRVFNKGIDTKDAMNSLLESIGREHNDWENFTADEANQILDIIGA